MNSQVSTTQAPCYEHRIQNIPGGVGGCFIDNFWPRCTATGHKWIVRKCANRNKHTKHTNKIQNKKNKLPYSLRYTYLALPTAATRILSLISIVRRRSVTGTPVALSDLGRAGRRRWAQIRGQRIAQKGVGDSRHQLQLKGFRLCHSGRESEDQENTGNG